MKQGKMLSIISSLMLIAPLMGTGMTASANQRAKAQSHTPRIHVIYRVHKHGKTQLKKVTAKLPNAKMNPKSKAAKKQAKILSPIIGPHHHGKKGLKINLAYFLSGSQNILKNKNYQRTLKAGLSKQGDEYLADHAGPSAFDCTGLMYYMFRKGMHEKLPTLVNTQCAWTHHKVSKKNRQPGDFIRMNNGGHIGMYIGHGYMLDAQGYGVDIEPAPNPYFIFNGYYRPSYK